MIVRRALKRIGPARLLLESSSNSDLEKLLELTNEQKQQLKEVGAKARKTLVDKIANAKTEATEQVLSSSFAENR